jgi:hypothetical protein
MRTMMKLYPDTASKKIFIFYNFHQVRDAVLLLLFAEKTNRFEKIFVYANAGRWETDVLRYYVDGKTYETICKRLKSLFDFREAPTDLDVKISPDMETGMGLKNWLP